MTFDGEVKTDVNKIEEFLEEKLAPPRWASPKPVFTTRLSLLPVHRQFRVLVFSGHGTYFPSCTCDVPQKAQRD